jgi:hypothetical protein
MGVVDSYRPMEHSMTGFGFGRLGVEKFITQVPAQFSVGMAPSDSYSAARAVTESAFRPVKVEVR